MTRKKTKAESLHAVRNRLNGWVVPSLVMIVTLVVFAGVLGNGFVDWDDDRILLENENFRGLSWWNIQWMFTTFYKSLYRPLTWMTFGFDYLIWGMNPAGYHSTSLLLHVANALLVYLLALRLYSLPNIGFETLGHAARRIGAGIIALLFAIHPLRVEAVAWVSARNDLLSGFFILLTVISYLIYVAAADDHSPLSSRWLGITVFAYLLAMLAKASNFTLPLVLLLMDAYPLRRWCESSSCTVGAV